MKRNLFGLLSLFFLACSACSNEPVPSDTSLSLQEDTLLTSTSSAQVPTTIMTTRTSNGNYILHSSTKPNSTIATTIPPIEKPTPQDLEDEQQRLNSVIQKITDYHKAGKVRSVCLSYKDSKESSNSQIITQWVQLIGAMQFIPVPYEVPVGDFTSAPYGYTLSFQTQSGEIIVGCGFESPYLHTNLEQNRKVMFRIYNYDDLQNTLNDTIKATGFFITD